MTSRWPLFLFVALILVSGCGRKAPLDEVVSARDGFGLMMWKGGVANEFTPQEWREFDEAVSELNYSVMISGEASGSAEVRKATLKQIDGMTVREVLEAGLGDKIKRLERDRAALAGFAESNRRIVAAHEGAGNEEAGAVETFRILYGQQRQRLAALDRQISEIRETLRRRGIVVAAD